MILPLAGRRPLPGVVSAASMPHGLGAGGLLADFPVSPDLLQRVFAHLRQLPFMRLAVRPNPLQANLWRTVAPPEWKTTNRKSHILDLSGGFDAAWSKQFHSTKRNRIRKGQRAGLVIERGNSPEFVRRFYDLYLLWSENRARDRGIPPALVRWLAARREPLWKFESTARDMSQYLQIYFAMFENKPVAGAIYLKMGKSGVYWRGASDAELLNKYPGNDLLQHEMIKDACEAGCINYHMGESGGVQSLENFKEGFGAAAHQYEEYSFERVPVSSTLNGANRLASHVVSRLVKRG